MCQVYVLDQQITEQAVIDPVALRFPLCHVRVSLNGSTLQTRLDETSPWTDYSTGVDSIDEAILREKVIERVDRAIRPYIFANMDDSVKNQFKSVETVSYAHTLKSQALRANKRVFSLWNQTDLPWHKKIIACFFAMCQTTYYGFYHPLYLTIRT